MEPVRGVYLWGGVGRGKTLMMDLFFDSLPFDDKLRYHFHRIMSRVHGRLADAARCAGSAGHRRRGFRPRGPRHLLRRVLRRRHRRCDAARRGFIEALFEQGVTLVATSNSAPQDLYRGGLQRQRFLPAIDLILQHTEVVHVDGLIDYRLRVLEAAEIWHAPLDPMADANLERYFRNMAPDRGTAMPALEVLGQTHPDRRRLPRVSPGSISTHSCAGPRSQEDYIEIARSFQTVIISGVPRLDENRENEARRFIALVDEFYDRRVNLIVSAAEPDRPDLHRYPARSRNSSAPAAGCWRCSRWNTSPPNTWPDDLRRRPEHTADPLRYTRSRSSDRSRPCAYTGFFCRSCADFPA